MCEKTNIRPPSKATMKIQWIPYMYADDGSNAGADKKKHHKCDVIMSRIGVSNLDSPNQAAKPAYVLAAVPV